MSTWIYVSYIILTIQIPGGLTQQVNILENPVYIKTNGIGHATCIIEGGTCVGINWRLPSVSIAALASAFTDGSFCGNVSAGYYQTCDTQNQTYNFYFTGTPTLHGASVTCQGEQCGAKKFVEDISSIYIIVPVVTIKLQGKSSTKMTVTAGQSTSISCVTGESRPPAKVLWYIGMTNVTSLSTETVNNRSSQMTITTSILTFIPNKLQNGLRVNCKATNTDSNTVELTTKPTLNVHYPPESHAVIVGKENTITVNDNETVTLICEVKGGNPLAVITWDCFGGIGTASSEVDIARSTITFTAKKSNSGQSCTCKASHPVGTVANDSVTVIVLYAATLISMDITGGSFIILEHSTPVITCTADGNPLPSITLRSVSNGTIISNVNSGSRLDYRLPYAKCEDAGAYRCEVVNKLSNQQKQENLKVLCSPKLSSESDVTVYRSLLDSLNLTAVVIAYPQSNVTWFFRTGVGTEMKLNEGVVTHSSGVVQTTTLYRKILDNTQFGKYSVIAENEIGVEKLIFNVEKTGPPSKPTHFESSLSTGTKVILQWQSGFNGGAEQKFYIKYAMSQKSKWETINDFIDDNGNGRYNLAVVPGLTPETHYTFAVYASSSFGNSSEAVTNSSTSNEEYMPRDTSESLYNAAVALLVIGILLIVAAACISFFVIRKYRLVMNPETKNIKSSDEAYCDLGDNREQPNVYDDCKNNVTVPETEKAKSDNEAYCDLGDNREQPNVYDFCKDNQGSRQKNNEQFYENASFQS